MSHTLLFPRFWQYSLDHKFLFIDSRQGVWGTMLRDGAEVGKGSYHRRGEGLVYVAVFFQFQFLLISLCLFQI